MALAISGAIFAIFVANVLMGALARAPFLGDVGEMLTLFAASVAFVVAILMREARRNRKD